MSDSPSKALQRIAVFAFVLLLVDRSRWPIVFIAYVVFRLSRTEFAHRAYLTFSRDFNGLRLLISVKREIKRRLAKNRPIHEVFLEQVKKHPNKLACIEVETGSEITYNDLNKLMNKYANVFKADGYKNGDVVSLFMENSIEFFALWLGLSKIGVVSAFINSNLKLEPLAHSINVAKSKCVITTSSLLATLQPAIDKELVPKDTNIMLISGKSEELSVLADKVSSASDAEPHCPEVNFQNVLCYIYTSGTTGNPKPAVIKHFRYYWISMGSTRSFGLGPEDVVYITMPMYHSAAGIMGIGSVISLGTTAVIRKKFSASNFWKDCVKYNCTASQYIGEICRYLLAQPTSAEEKQHKVRVMWGNGLRPEIWKDFVSRFNIKRVGELYGSTEGNSNIVNIDNHVGACGFMPIYTWLSFLYPVRLVKVNEETGELVRDERGLCICCNPGETGEMVGTIKSKDPLLKFEGYVSDGDTQKKIYRDVFKKGDQCFASGDILHWDELGYLFFKDRRGDTFRWKGENVSTTEVEGILQPVMEVEDATVYGVQIGKMEGRAGMAAIVLRAGGNADDIIRKLGERLTSNLASYAVPVFIRICKEVDKTGTFKLKKTDLQKDGFDLKKCKGDKLYYWSAGSKQYEPLDAKMQDDIETGAYNRI